MPENQNPPLNGVTPYLTVRGASEAAEFYKRAFGAEEVLRTAADDGKRLIHCHLRINNADVMMSDEFPEHGFGLGEGPNGVTLHLAVDDADKWYNRAIAAGASVRMPIGDQFWGDRYGQVKDPFGHTWSIGSPIKKA
jgi:PhnB protein